MSKEMFFKEITCAVKKKCYDYVTKLRLLFKNLKILLASHSME
jgi:hypothetical protein